MNKQTAYDKVTNICETCSEPNTIGDLFCHFCGNSLTPKDKTLPVRPPAFDELLKSVDTDESILAFDQLLMIEMVDQDTTLVIQPKAKVVLGRSALLGKNTQKIDIDLVPFGGFTKGVSSQHATIRREFDSVFLMDMGSSNGTILNGIQLEPNELHQIYNGDVAYLGSLPIRFSF